MDIERLKHALESSWSKETCYPKNAKEREAKKAFLGQCAVTALIVQDFFGGDLLFCDHNNHYWNKLPNGEIIDFTKEQFGKNTIICSDKIVDRNLILNSKGAELAQTRTRYEILKERVQRKLNTIKS